MGDLLPLVSPREYEARLDEAIAWRFPTPTLVADPLDPATLRADAELEQARAGTRHGDEPAIQEHRRLVLEAAISHPTHPAGSDQ